MTKTYRPILINRREQSDGNWGHETLVELLQDSDWVTKSEWPDFPTEQEALDWIERNDTRGLDYTIIPIYSFEPQP